MLKKFLLYIFVFLFFGFSFAQELSWGQDTWENIIDTCSYSSYVIDWEFDIKTNVVSEYNIRSQSWSDDDKIKSIHYSLYKWDKLLEVMTWSRYYHNFVNNWIFSLQANIFDNNGCSFLIKKNINIYKNFVYYIWDGIDELNLWFEDNFEKNWYLFKKLELSKSNILIEDEILSKLQDNTYFLKNSDIIIINNKNFSSIFQIFSKLQSNDQYTFAAKKIFVVSELNDNFLKRLLAKHFKNLWTSKLFIIDAPYLLSFLSNISFGKDIKDLAYVKSFSLSFEESSKLLPLSYIVDILIYNWFPSTLISLILTLAIWALLISIFRQIIGFSVFGIYSPLLFAVSMSVLWIKFSMVLLFIAFLSTLLTRFFTKKIYLLYSAKISLLVILYFVVTILVLWFDKIFGLNFVDLTIFNNSFIIFPIVFLIVTAEKVFYEWFSLFSKWWWFSFVEFLLVAWVVYFIINWASLRYVLISYPELIVFVFLINIIVWRFTWLQLLEYLRFMPIIKKHFDEEE